MINRFNLDFFLSRDNHGLWLSNWKMVFVNEYRNFRFNYPPHEACLCSEINGRIYMHNDENRPVMHFSTSVEELKTLVSYVNKAFHKYECIKDNYRIPWEQVARDAYYLIEKDKEEELKRKQELEKKVEKRSQIAHNLESPKIPDILHNIKSGHEWIENCKFHSSAKPLFDVLWYEKEICLLFADSNIGKSILATQMAFEIAKREHKVVYFDYELREDTFADRFAGIFKNNPAISEYFLRCQPNPDLLICGNAINHILVDITDIIKKYHAEVIIIDNISFINANAKNNTRAARLIYHLKKIASDNCISMLILAHTSKRNPNRPLTQNDLAGSKALFNFADSAFAIGQSLIDEDTQYIKQLKSRSAKIKYDADNVLLIHRSLSNGYLHFEHSKCEKESLLLSEPNKSVYAQYLKKSISQLEADGKSQRDIAAILGISQSKVSRLKNL